MATMPGPLIGTTEAAEVCGVERSTFFRWVQLGQITPVTRLRGTTGALLFDRDTVVALAERKRVAAS